MQRCSAFEAFLVQKTPNELHFRKNERRGINGKHKSPMLLSIGLLKDKED